LWHYSFGYPTDFDLIENHIASGSYNFDLPSNRDSKGFPALDYLLNGMASSDAEIVAVGYSQVRKLQPR